MSPGPSSEVIVVGFPPWKRHWARRFLHEADLRFVDSPAMLRGIPKPTVATWGMDFPDSEFPTDARILRVEDGFLRSKGLGAAFVPPVSWVVDARGMHFDATRPSDLEEILASMEFDGEILRRAKSLRAALVASGLTKYNVGSSIWERPLEAKRVILVPGQVESDASIKYGCPGIRTNLELLKTVRDNNSGAWILYKPHPDVLAGFRNTGRGENEASQWCDTVVANNSMGDLLERVDEVHTLTSLAGFEGLLRGKKVETYGIPFYAGWGLTRDHQPISRRNRKLLLDELAAGVLIEYPIYSSLVSGASCTPETTVQELQNWDSLSPRFRHSGSVRILGWVKSLAGRFMAHRQGNVGFQ
jgi:capsular polysaccharide export protein